MATKKSRPLILSEHLCECGCGERTHLIQFNSPRRGYVKGEPSRYLSGHNTRGSTRPTDVVALQAARMRGRRAKAVVDGYRTAPRFKGMKPQYIHRLRAERALGHPLPTNAVVHHADGTKDEDGPLVICEDSAYHLFLHARMRIKAAGGDPNTDKICGACRRPKNRLAEFNHRGAGVSAYCRVCENAYLRLKRSGVGDVPRELRKSVAIGSVRTVGFKGRGGSPVRPPDGYVSAIEAAKLAGCSPAMIHYLALKGSLPISLHAGVRVFERSRILALRISSEA